MRRSVGKVAVLALAAAALLAGCGSKAAQPADGTSPISVVTSTNVWGEVAAQIGGGQVTVTSLISDPAVDPHSFEPNAQARLAISKAALVIENGGGYDDYLQQLLAAAGNQPVVVNAVDLSGRSTGQPDFNEHVWYDLPTAAKVATGIADDLTGIRPGQAALFRHNLATFTGRLDGLVDRTAEIKAAHGGTRVAVTEPVPLYLTEAAGLVNATPEAFSTAIEEGTDVPPAVLSDTLALFTDRKVAVLAYNEQTSSPETEQLLAAAKANSIPVVAVTETLPAGEDYLGWMGSTITAFAAALNGSTLNGSTLNGSTPSGSTSGESTVSG